MRVIPPGGSIPPAARKRGKAEARSIRRARPERRPSTGRRRRRDQCFPIRTWTFEERPAFRRLRARLHGQFKPQLVQRRDPRLWPANSWFKMACTLPDDTAPSACLDHLRLIWRLRPLLRTPSAARASRKLALASGARHRPPQSRRFSAFNHQAPAMAALQPGAGASRWG